jgi:hypothetical protein
MRRAVREALPGEGDVAGVISDGDRAVKARLRWQISAKRGCCANAQSGSLKVDAVDLDRGGDQPRLVAELCEGAF